MIETSQARWAERASGLMNSAKSFGSVASKLENLRELRELLLFWDSSLLPEFAPWLIELEVQLPAAARKFLIEILGEIGKKHLGLLPEIIPTLITYLKDDSPPVARQAIATGTSLFCHIFVKVAIQGIISFEVNETLKSSWSSVLKFKNAVLPLATQSGVDGIRLLAVKFIEAMVLLYTPDPVLPSDFPKEFDETQFSMSWLKGGHPLLNVGDLTTEAGQSLRLLLDQLRSPKVNFLNNSMAIVLINCLSAIARKRPLFYGRILPVLLSLDPDISIIKEVRVSGAHHALRSAFSACLLCTHSSAMPWRPRLVEALRVINGGEPLEQQQAMREKSPKLQLIFAGSSTSIKEQLKEDKPGKRSLDEVPHEALTDGTISEKRIRQSPETKDFSKTDPFYDSAPLAREADSSPVLQLVGMFGSLVAQGSKALEPLEILISSISSDLLAEVVIANMRYLPPCCPMANDEDESSLLPRCSDPGISTLNSTLMDFSLSSIFSSLVIPQLNSPPFPSQDMPAINGKQDEECIIKDEKMVNAEPSVVPVMCSPDATNLISSEKIITFSQPYENESETELGKIPGLDSNENFNEFRDLSTCEETKEPMKDYVVSSGTLICHDLSPSTSTVSHSLETSSSRASVADDIPFTMSRGLLTHCLLPKMAAYDIDLSDEQKDKLQKAAFSRIIEVYKEVTISGDSNVRLSVLSHVGTEFSLDLDPWGLLQKHVISDYMNHEGHELTLRVLYRLFREAEQDHDFLSSRTAMSVYESFMSNVVEALRDAFPATDKSLGKLLGEAPSLSEGALKMLEGLCLPENKEKHDADSQNGDRVTQGLSALWSLILLRPLSRDRCLQIVLQSAVHHIEEVRMKAIRLVANKLFPMASISQKIENFASEKLNLVLDVNMISSSVASALESSHTPLKENELENSSKNGVNIESLSYDPSLKSAPSSSFIEAQRCMSLYFALCTKKHLLLRQIFTIYKNVPKAAVELVHLHIPILVRTIGASPELLGIILNPPPGSNDLLMQTLHILTDGVVPSQELISSVTTLLKSKTTDVGLYIPILPFLSKDEILSLIPQLVNLPVDKFQLVLSRIIQDSPQAANLLSPAEVLITIHGIDSEKDGIPLKKIMDACSVCFEQRHVFSQLVLAKVLNQLVEQIPLPLLFMRTVIQAIGVFPGLVDFVMEILSRLVSKQIWKYPKLWVGFLKCAIQTKPQSFNVLLQLPAAQLENALNKNPVLKPSLAEHASQANIRSTLPRSTLVVLGLANEAQRLGPALQRSPNQAPDASGSITDPTASMV